ncbi:ribosome hibernation-promoting factor, HPF/YfiA family [Thalassotalea agarivorans]|uniref:Ribosome hibernation promoting factor n=1 Tax=Thalassotalea agarivorans TaxID=349064 RepID=A0A1H9YLE0_THASX|nr:ribosome-associated translation inhibitor RaiA [Thalassotalea agarivorans]SES69937.1 ribosomal subunit interface protein [Thalassotalea agarivorans]
MKVNITGHHVDVTPAVQAHVEEKFHKIANHFPTLISTNVFITKQHGKHQVEMTANYEGSRLSATAEGEVMYPAIAGAIKKLDAALKHRKGILKSNLHHKPDVTTSSLAHEKVQEMRL